MTADYQDDKDIKKTIEEANCSWQYGCEEVFICTHWGTNPIVQVILLSHQLNFQEWLCSQSLSSLLIFSSNNWVQNFYPLRFHIVVVLYLYLRWYYHWLGQSTPQLPAQLLLLVWKDVCLNMFSIYIQMKRFSHELGTVLYGTYSGDRIQDMPQVIHSIDIEFFSFLFQRVTQIFQSRPSKCIIFSYQVAKNRCSKTLHEKSLVKHFHWCAIYSECAKKCHLFVFKRFYHYSVSNGYVKFLRASMIFKNIFWCRWPSVSMRSTWSFSSELYNIP